MEDKIDQLVAEYITTRDMIKAIEIEQKKALEPLKGALEQLNINLLERLNQVGGNSIATDSGTVYRTEKKSASLADPKAFMDYVLENDAFDLLDRKANVTAVAEFIKENNTPPPGVNFSSTYVVGVRRAS